MLLPICTSLNWDLFDSSSNNNCEGAPEEPKHRLPRAVLLMSVVVGLLISTAYSAVLTSFLAVEVLSLPFEKWQDILNVASSWKLGVMKESSDYDMFFNAYNVSLSRKHH